MAICVAQAVAAAVVDGDSVRDHDWSVVRSLKMVRPLPVILMEERTREASDIPEGVDAVVRIGDTEGLLKALERLLGNGDLAENSAVAS